MLGEVGEDPEGLAGDVVLRKAAPSSILDLKTTSISRPFVVSTKTEQGLLQVSSSFCVTSPNARHQLERKRENSKPVRCSGGC